jgi:hypothetical protein
MDGVATRYGNFLNNRNCRDEAQIFSTSEV